MTNQHETEKTTTFTPLTPGSEIGSYRLIRELGMGGMGQVFLAEDSRLDRKVALKFLAPQLYLKEEFRIRFTREAKSAAKLNHNNIITIHDVGELDDRAYISMEYVDGRSLRQMIDTRSIDYDKGLNIFEQLCQGLKKAHECGVIHRDLKPSNIIITEDFQVKILDFGLAKGISDGELTSTGTALGTVNYMSPEQAQGKIADQRSDIFSIGILLYELATGVNPFVRGHMPATIHAIVYEPIGQISEFNKNLSPSWQIVIEKALGKKPEDRYQSIDELLDDINRVKSGQDITPAAVAQPNVERTDTPSLAVLHLRNLGSESDDFLTYGITEDLIVDLGKLGNLRVVPMRRILKYKNSNLELDELAKNLNVNLILDGSIMKSDSGVRISAQLVDVTKDDIIWSERWEESLGSLPKVKSALAEGISSALEVDSSVIRKADIVKAETSNPEAYDLYLKGKFAFHNRKIKEDSLKAIEFFNQALKLEPDMLAAQVGLAEIHSTQEEFDQAKQILLPALEVAEKSNLKADEARVRVILGSLYNRISEYETSIEHHKQAIKLYRELNDHNGEAHAISELLKPFSNIGLFDEVPELEERMGLLIEKGVDPAYVSEWLLVYDSVLSHSHQISRALEVLEEGVQLARANDLKPQLCKGLYLLANVYSQGDGKKLQIAMSYIEEARFLAERLDEPMLMHAVDFFSIVVEFNTGGFRSAANRTKKVLPKSVKNKNEIGIASMKNGLLQLLYELGEFKKAKELEPEVEQAVSGVRGDSHRDFFRVEQQIYLAYGLFIQDQQDQAIEKWQEALKKSKEDKNDWGTMAASRYLGVTKYLHGEFEPAIEYLKVAHKLAIEQKELEHEVAASGYLSLIGAKKGNLEEGKNKLRLLIDRTEGTLSEVRARRIYGTMLLESSSDSKDKQEGRQQLLQSLALARKMEWAVEKNIISELIEKHS